MRKLLCWLLIGICLIYGAGILADLAYLQENVIRLHVVGASDSETDQAIKLQVKDAVNAYLTEVMENCTSIDRARDTLRTELVNIQTIANRRICELGCSDSVQVTLGQEAFGRRDYDTFSLPSGIYESLRIRIGKAEGRNWWCVVFPTLCTPTTGEDLRDVTAGAGFPEELYQTIRMEDGYEIRFFVLDLLGRLQNFWFEG